MDSKTLKKMKIGVLMGGQSAEREVSLRSGAAVVKALKACGYAVKAIAAESDFHPVLKKEKIELAFIALHGGHGENGAVQGMLEIMGIPYTGSGVLASALAMDKEASKKIFLYHGITVPACRIVRQQEFRAKGFRLSTGFKLPWIVKPATEGSSVGVEIVRSMADAGKAVKQAFAYGTAVVIEQYIRGKEVQIAILNDRPIGGVEVRPSLEFYSYEAKYTAGLTEYVIPPALDNRTYKKAQKAALAAHRALGCRGATRVDLIVDDQKKIFVLEVNTIPGMTETSLLPKIAASAGLDFPLLIEKIIEEAIV